MTSRFRTNWTKGGQKSSTSPIFDSSTCHNNHRSADDEFINEYYDNDRPDGNIAIRGSNGTRIVVRDDRTSDNGNGKSREKSGPGASCYGNERELNEDRESPDRNYHRRSCREDFRCRDGDAEVEDCSPMERRMTPMGKKGASSFAFVTSAAARYDLVENANDDLILESSRLPSSSLLMMTTTKTMTANGNSSTRGQRNNGSTKQVKRIEPRHDHHGTIGSLTRDERPVLEDSSIDVTNSRPNDVNDRSNPRTNNNGALSGNKRDRSAKRSSQNDRNENIHTSSGAMARNKEINDHGSIDREDLRRRRDDRSYSPVDRVANGSNGDSLTRRGDRRGSRENERFYSARRFEDNEDFGSMDRRSRRHAEGRSYSPPEDNDDSMINGNHDISSTRLERRDKRVKDQEIGPLPRRSSRGYVDERGIFRDNDDDSNGAAAHRTNGSRGENGSAKKYDDIDEENSHGRNKGSSRRKSHVHPKASPDDFDVQIHRYERALRTPRRDSDLTRKSSFKDHGSDLSRKSSFEEPQRSREFRGSKRNNHKQRDMEITRRGSSEDREHERVSRKSSFKNHDRESTRKSSLTSRNLLDTGPIGTNNGNDNYNKKNGRKNGSHNRDRSESLRRDDEPSITRRRSSRFSDDDDYDYEEHDRLTRKNDRHSRPLTPPIIRDSGTRDESRDGRSRISPSSKERGAQNNDDFARNYVQDHRDCRSKTHVETEDSSLAAPGRDRFSSSTRRVVSTRSFNDSRQDNNSNFKSGGKKDNVSNKLSMRELVVDDEDDRDDVGNSGFSTIERNGTTVIRILTNSESPDVGQTEPRSRRRASHREVMSSTRYRKYEDEAEDEDEDDEVIERDNERRDELSKRDYRVGPRRLWSNRDGGVQITDLEDGQPCLHCGETCPGFSPHSWRKNCTSCKCPREAHDVCHEEWVSVRARLGLKGEGPNNYVGFDPRDRGLTWAPPGLPPSKVEEYFSMLPEISVPRIGTPGERHRDRQLATQLPKQDLARAYCRHLDSQHSASADDFMAARNEIALDIGSVKEILERGHECGVCHEPLKYGSLVVSASKLGLSYHPSCFQCTQCRELLVDLAYCVHDDALYCERHYAEQLKPRCAACDELIFSGEYTKAMNKDWHSGHFCCWQCDESLTGQRYVLRDEHPYCIKCYESVFANGCEECSKIIGIDSKDLSYKDKHWHEACFLCNKCRVSLVDKQFGSKVDKIYCGNCYDAQFASRCDGCGEIFRAGTKKMEYKTRQWHEKCFCCVVCKNPIGTKSFIPREQEIYCAGCYEDKFATRCVKCNKIITSGGVTYKNEPWHRDCFTCSNCDNSLAGQRFTSRDDKPYCAECFGELFAKRCTACTKPITGIGGTRFISFEDRHWHNNCFICAGCNTSLVGRGFITDGDDIICPECAKQKLSE